MLEEEGEKHPEMKAKVEKVGEKIKAKKESLLQTDDGEGKDFNPEDLTIVKILEHLFEGLPEEDRAEIEAKIEEIKKMLEEEGEKHPEMKAKVEKVGEKIKAKKESLLQTDDGEGKDFNPEDLTIVKIIEHLFEGLPEEDRAEVEAKIEEIKKMLEEDRARVEA